MADIKCPKCDANLSISMKESLKPYSMTIRMHPLEGRMIAAETISRSLFALSKALKAAGDVLDHKTEVYLTDASVGEDMSISLTVSAIPIRAEPDLPEPPATIGDGGLVL